MEKTTLIQDPKDIQLNEHHEIDQILGHPPSWILKWGISFVFVAAVIFILISWLIKYPDVIPAEVIITTKNPSIVVIARGSGKIQTLLVNDKEYVEREALLATLDNTAISEHIIELEMFLKELEKIEDSKSYLNIKLPSDLVLGSFQSSYAGLVQKIKDYQHYLNQFGVFSKIKSIKSQIVEIRKLNKALEQQKKTMGREVEIVHTNFERNKTLYESGTVSIIEVENAETSYLQYKRQLDNLSTQLINNNLNIEQLETQIIDLKQGRNDGVNSRELSVFGDIQQLKSEIENWKEAFWITAPISGRVSMSKIWSEQQFVHASEEVFTIVPEEGVGEIVGKANLPSDGSGKVEIGQPANIQLNGFPFQEFGMIRATVKSISLIPQEQNYLLEIEMPDSLITTYNKVIPFKQEMSGIANIITEDRRILERVFDKVLNILKNKS